jgi:hypothetical protein
MKIAWDVERAVLAAMLLLVVAGLGFIAWQRSVADELSGALAGAERNLAQIGVLTAEVQALQEEMNADILASGKLEAYAYIERQLTAVRLGKSSFASATPKEDVHAEAGFKDTHYTLNQATQGRESFTREEIAMFLLYIEGNTTRMKATGIRLERAGKAALEDDAWKARLVITDRAPIGRS